MKVISTTILPFALMLLINAVANGAPATVAHKCPIESYVFRSAGLLNVKVGEDSYVAIQHPADKRIQSKRNYTETVPRGKPYYQYTGWLYPDQQNNPTDENALYSWVASRKVKNIFNVATVKLKSRSSLKSGIYYAIYKTKCVCPGGSNNQNCQFCKNAKCTFIQTPSFTIVGQISW